LESTAELLVKTTAGDVHAWRSLQLRLAPQITRIVRAHRSMRAKGLAGLPDDVAEVGTLTLERLASNNFENLRRFLARESNETDASGSFDRWLYGAIDLAVRDHLRARFGRAPRKSDPALCKQPSKRDINTNAERLDQDDDAFPLYAEDVASRLTVAEVFAHVEATFFPFEVRALRMYYLEDQSFSQIADVLKLRSEKDAEALIRRLNARLRYHFMRSNTPAVAAPRPPKSASDAG
jgi:hypothetical protein